VLGAAKGVDRWGSRCLARARRQRSGVRLGQVQPVAGTSHLIAWLTPDCLAGTLHLIDLLIAWLAAGTSHLITAQPSTPAKTKAAADARTPTAAPSPDRVSGGEESPTDHATLAPEHPAWQARWRPFMEY
jgi:hypothetical protein